MFELRINNRNYSFEPQTCNDVLYESFHRGKCSKLSFNIAVKGQTNPQLSIREGDMVSLKATGQKMFFGTVFQRKRNSDGVERFIAYDQLRYLKNKDTYIYSGKKASEVVRMIALDYRLRFGKLEQTRCVIPHHIEDNVTLLDIIENALDFEFERSGQRFTLIDEFGSLTLKNESQMFSGVVLDKSVIGGLSFFSSIESRSNRVKVSRYDRSAGKREVFIASDTDSENQLGVLQHYVRIGDKNESLSNRAYSLLALHNKDERSILISNALGDAKIRGGSRVILDLDEFKGSAMVLQCNHKLSENQHLMDLLVGI